MTRDFTFIDFDINRKGITENARAHLMKDRVRSKKEAKKDWMARNMTSSFRCMQPKQEGSPADVCQSRTTYSSYCDKSIKRPPDSIAPYDLVIDLDSDECIMNSPQTKGSKASSPTSTEPDLSSADSETSSRNSSLPRIPVDGRHAHTSPLAQCLSKQTVVQRVTSHDAALTESPTAVAQYKTSTEDNYLMSYNPRQASEFGFAGACPKLDEEYRRCRRSMLDVFSAELPEHDEDFTTPSDSPDLVDKRVNLFEASLAPADRFLFGYFLENAEAMLGLDKYPDIVATFNPLRTVFLPFALASEWCFETMVLLFTSCYYRNVCSRDGLDVQSADVQFATTRQNYVLARIRSRISALASRQDSNDEDIVAFLFLALSEYLAGDQEMGTLHLGAWKRYCEMRRKQNIARCGLNCKIVVWWCMSMLVGAEIDFESIFSSATRRKIRDEPALLFRHMQLAWFGGNAA